MKKLIFLIKKIFMLCALASIVLISGCDAKKEKSKATLLTQKVWKLTHSKHKKAGSDWAEDTCEKAEIGMHYKGDGTGIATATSNAECEDPKGDFTWILDSNQKTLTITSSGTSIKCEITLLDEITLSIDFTVTVKGPSSFGKLDTVVTWEKIYNHLDFDPS